MPSHHRMFLTCVLSTVALMKKPQIPHSCWFHNTNRPNQCCCCRKSCSSLPKPPPGQSLCLHFHSKDRTHSHGCQSSEARQKTAGFEGHGREQRVRYQRKRARSWVTARRSSRKLAHKYSGKEDPHCCCSHSP